ncbi:MAG TPA: amino acid racemase [Chitinophagaceae bacterium]|nr:amino acid racemase [Bacteroidales bacterium]HLG39386.1 amino acid racemase [Chitinophagaceae bacterium]
MKRIGLIGGMGPEATLEYYSGIIDAFKSEKGDLNYPEIIIYSVNLSEFIELMKARAYDEIVDLMLGKIIALKMAGADFAAFTANTPHLLFDRINERSPLPLISIVEATCHVTKSRGLKMPGLFGTGFTMNGTFFQDVFGKRGINVVVPDEEDRKIINEKLFSEIELGIFKDETRELLVTKIQKMVLKQQIDSLILGCTEFPLILTEKEYAGIPMLNTTRIHVDAIVSYCSGD